MKKETAETTLLLGGCVITVDEDRRILDPGAVAVRDDKIVEVNDREKILESYPAGKHIELEESIILPGLIDSHGHAGHGLTKGLGSDGDSWMDAVQDVYFHASDEKFWEVESYLSAIEHLESGVTTSISFTGSSPRIDDPKYAEAAATGYAELGLRHIVNIGPPNPPYPKSYTDASTNESIESGLDDSIETTAAVIDSLHGKENGRLSVFVGPSALVPEVEYNGKTESVGLMQDGSFKPAKGTASKNSIEQLKKVLELSKEKGVNIHTHAYGGQVSAAADSVPEILGPELSLAHCAGLSPSELELMAENNVSASHGPLTHAYARARFPLVEALEAGTNVAISTDGSAPDRSFDLLSQGRIAAQLQRAYFNDTSILPAGKILEMITIDAAKALGKENEIGSLESGKKADIIAIDLKSAKLRPRTALLHRVVHYASGADVEFAMIDGSICLMNDSIRNINVEQVLVEADEIASDTFERAGVDDLLDTSPNMWNSIRY